MANKLFVGNIPWSVSSDQLREIFSEVGEIEEAVVITDRMSGRSKGFGFVTFVTEEDAQAAIEKFHEYEYEGRNLTVNVARPREER